MAESLGEAVLDLRTDQKQFDKGINTAEKSTSRLGTAMTKTRTSVVSLKNGLIALGAIAIVGKIGRFVTSTLEAQDAVGKLSEQIGISTESLSTLQFAAEQTGPGAEKLAAGLQVMSKRLGEAATGTGQAGDALEQLGLNIDELLALTPDEQFNEIAKALQSIEDPARKNAIASDLFSRANQELVLTLEAVGDGTRDFRGELEQLGGVITTEMTQSAAGALDALQKLQEQQGGLANALIASLAPAIETVATTTTNIIIEIQAFTQVLSETRRIIAEFVTAVIAEFKRLFESAVNSIKSMGSSIIDSVKNMASVIVGNSIIPDMVANILNEFDLMRKGSIDSTTDMANESIGIFDQLKNIVAGDGKIGRQGGLLGEMAELGTTIGRIWAGDWTAIVDLLSENTISTIADMVKQVISLFDDLIGSAKSAVNEIGDILGGIPVVGDVVGGIGDVVGDVASGIGDAISSISPFASGGIVTQPTLGLVGEAGPEAIIPLDQLSEVIGANRTIKIEQNIQGITADEVERQTMRAFRKMSQEFPLA